MLLYRIDPPHLSCPVETPSRFRDWMTAHAYRCLPLAVANELGVDILCPMDVTYEWDGGDEKASVNITNGKEIATSHFGLGSLTFNLGYIWKLPKQAEKQLLFMPVPNEFDRRFTAMTALIEPAALTYPIYLTLKLTEPGKHTIKKGTRLGRVIIVDARENTRFSVKITDKLPKAVAGELAESRRIRTAHAEDKSPDKKMWTRFYFDKAKFTSLKARITGGK